MARYVLRKALVRRGDFDLRCTFPTKEAFLEYLERERSVPDHVRKMFNKTERLIFFCKYIIGWGRRRIRNKCGISERQVGNFFNKVREMG